MTDTDITKNNISINENPLQKYQMELSNDNLRKEDNDQQVLDTVIET